MVEGFKTFTIQVPVDLHKKVKLISVSQGVSIRSLIRTLLEAKYADSDVVVPSTKAKRKQQAA